MADSSSPEAIRKSIKTYLLIGLTLIIATVITVALSYYEFPSHSMNILVGMIVAAVKVSLVGLYFMHLNHERSLIYKVLAFTTVSVIALFLLTYMSHEDPLVWSGF